MISILIMDDNETKVNALKRLLLDECFLEERNVHVARNVHEGRVKLREQVYDLLLLDMVLPSRDGEEAQEDVGASFIDELFCSPSMKMPIHIIGLTQYDATFDSLKHRFEDKLWYLIKYSEFDIYWKNRIRSKVNQIIETKKQIEDTILNQNKYDIGIICALQEEFDMLKIAFQDCGEWKRQRVDGFSQDVYTLSLVNAYGKSFRICALSPNVPCMVPTAVLSIEMINLLKIDYLFMSGIAAGIQYEGLNIGDVIISKSVQDYSAGKLIENKEKRLELLREINVIQAASEMITKASDLASDRDMMAKLNSFIYDVLKEDCSVKAKIAPIVSGPYVVAANEMVNEIKKNADRKLCALDMEGYGLYYAANLMKKNCLWIKSVSDFADAHKNDDKHKLAALASGRFLYLLIKEYL